MQDRALVVCFHSVGHGDSSLVCPPEDFADYCRLLSDHFEVIGLSALLDRLRDGRDISRCAVVTFDDGYEDNYTVAAPILEAHRMTATVFVATDFLGSDHQAWWDTEHGIESRWMSWDDARDLRDRGFEIGAHTCSHADLGAIAPREARREIVESVDRIEAELGERPTLFAYPFGGADNITDSLRAYVGELGLRCCPSSDGGLVTPDADPLRLPRVPITPWYADVWQFGFEVMRLRDRTAALSSRAAPH